MLVACAICWLVKVRVTSFPPGLVCLGDDAVTPRTNTTPAFLLLQKEHICPRLVPLHLHPPPPPSRLQKLVYTFIYTSDHQHVCTREGTSPPVAARQRGTLSSTTTAFCVHSRCSLAGTEINSRCHYYHLLIMYMFLSSDANTLHSCRNTPPSTTSRSRHRYPRSTPFSVSSAYISSSFSSTLPALSSLTSPDSLFPDTTRCRPCSAPAKSMTLRCVYIAHHPYRSSRSMNFANLNTVAYGMHSARHFAFPHAARYPAWLPKDDMLTH